MKSRASHLEQRCPGMGTWSLFELLFGELVAPSPSRGRSGGRGGPAQPQGPFPVRRLAEPQQRLSPSGFSQRAGLLHACGSAPA